MMYSEVGTSQNFEIEQDWIDYKSDKFLKFNYICDKMVHCNDLAAQMHEGVSRTVQIEDEIQSIVAEVTNKGDEN